MNVTPLCTPVIIAPSSVIGQYCTLGYPKEARPRSEQAQPGSTLIGKPVVVGERCLIFNQVVLFDGVEVGDDCVIEDRVRIGYDSRLGARTRLVYGAYVCDRATIGADTRVAGFVAMGRQLVTVLRSGATWCTSTPARMRIGGIGM